MDVDCTRYVATGLTQIRELFDNEAAPETGNLKDDDGDCRSLVVQSVVTVRLAVGSGDDGDFHAILCRRIHCSRIVRRGRFRDDGET